MTKVIIIGNSHVVALRQGWELISSSYPQVDMSFFAVPMKVFDEAELGETLNFGFLRNKSETPSLWHRTKEMFGATSIDLSAADVVIYSGYNYKEAASLAVLFNYSVDGIYEVEGRQRISQACYAAICDSIADDVLPEKAWQNWKSRKLFMIGPPRLSEAVQNSDEPRHEIWRSLANAPPIGAGVLAFYLTRAAARFAKAGINLVIPPESLFGPSGLTLDKFRAGATSLLSRGAPTPETDYSHMNAEYGATILGLTLDQALTSGAAPT